MDIAVRSDLVPRGSHIFDQPRMALRNPADDEHGRADVEAIEQIQQKTCCRLDARRQPIPVFRP
jgi:hypothetical protein